MYVAHRKDEIPVLCADADERLEATLNSIKTVDKGVCVQVSCQSSSFLSFLSFLRTVALLAARGSSCHVYARECHIKAWSFPAEASISCLTPSAE